MKTAVVTGGASGIGLTCARHLVDHGWHVAVLDAAKADLSDERIRTALADGGFMAAGLMPDGE